MTMLVGKAEVFKSDEKYDSNSLASILREVVRSRAEELPKLYAVFEYNAETGKYSRSTADVIDDLITHEASIALREAITVSEKTNTVFAVIRLRAHQTAPNTIVYDESDEVYAIVIQGKGYRKL